MKDIYVDFNAMTGKIKPLHGVNCAPIISYYNFSLFHYLEEIGTPYCRLHDFGGMFGGTHFVDVENIFPDMNADENDPDSYDFALTDKVMEELDKMNVKPFYRLGPTIENGHKIKAYHIYPPKDNEKWARICANIIRHYNEGWANGYKLQIEYWEIWNEPDNHEAIEDNPMWKGTKEQFYEHYKVVSKHLKKEFPYIKVGGYGSSGFYAIKSDAQKISAANSSSWMEYFIDFFHGFLNYITENNCPLDFFSWHTYAPIEESITHANYVRHTLDQYGFVNTESILNEWNPDFQEKGSAVHAAKLGGMLCAMQNTSVDQMEFYTGNLSPYGSLFQQVNPITYEVTKEFYVFKAFYEIYKLGKQVSSVADIPGFYTLAATNRNADGFLMVNTNGENIEVHIQGFRFGSEICLWRIDEKNNYTKYILTENDMTNQSIELAPYSVTLLLVKR